LNLGRFADLFLQISWPLTGIVGTYLIANKNKWGWIFYCYSNVAAIIFLLAVGKYIPIIQYGVYMILNVIGIVKWFGFHGAGSSQNGKSGQGDEK